LGTPQLISMQGFAFRGWPLSLLATYAFPARALALPSNQLLEETKQMKPTFTIIKKRITNQTC
ncbi:hypothetical protein, partial [Priestia megaterium]|uniref:hypothetical protein n=1 Tax=Priestia megaterium TaxID=1404 RepID=UPI0030000028